MDLLLFRHGEAVENAPGLGDAGRWLTAKGRRVSRKVARWLDERSSRRPTAIWTSSLVRSVQTAEILAAELGLEEEVLVRPELAPSGDLADLVRLIEAHRGRGPLALVGHEPGLSMLARNLLGDVAWPGIKKSGVAAIRLTPAEGEQGRREASFRFLLLPKGMELVRSLDVISQEEAAPPQQASA
ncbi:SixA phosphatase family protein [Polyangium sorediatum]|uniref:Histidine phosphatase family protein n=1 Tax=Polyangium sorediatum TaxID=889274 RepID=A0ABT6NMU9_9BACT|nr:histidine phosphatase family protein [Polyangium sorediatum]MDI1429655.1 histidine phosphatase family protein [Polyangium sorediatum]